MQGQMLEAGGQGHAPRRPTSAMVLAAGLGKRMRPVTTTTPKPLIEVGGRALIDHMLDRLAEIGITHVVVNVHYLADLVEVHLAKRAHPAIRISDERAALLDTGGGVKKALPLLDDGPVFVANSDSIWIEGTRPNLARLIDAWDPERMDVLLMVAAASASIGYEGRGDYAMDPEGRLTRRMERTVAPFAYAGAALFDRRMFDDTPDGPFSLNLLFDRAQEAGRLYGMRMDGLWLHVGTPDAIRRAEAAILENTA